MNDKQSLIQQTNFPAILILPIYLSVPPFSRFTCLSHLRLLHDIIDEDVFP